MHLMLVRFRRSIAYAVILFVLIVSFYWLIHSDRVLTKQFEWCDAQEEPQPYELCYGIAEREFQSFYYLKIITLSVLAFGSTAIFLMASDKERG